MATNRKSLCLLCLAVALCAGEMLACTAFVVGKKASATGRVIVGHNNDGSATMRYALLEAKANAQPIYESGMAHVPSGASPSIYWQGVFSKNPRGTGDVLLNEHGVIMFSNHGGFYEEWDGQKTALPDEGAASALTEGGIGLALRFEVIRRARTAAEGVSIATNLLERYGYANSSRTFAIADKDEAWVLCAVLGRRYVARRCPDDAVMAYPNVMPIGRIRAGDIISPSVAAKGAGFDFTAAYQGLRTIADPTQRYRRADFYRVAAGVDAAHGNEAWEVRPRHLVSVDDIERGFSTHYEGTDHEAKVRHPEEVCGVIWPICRLKTLESVICEFGATAAETRVLLARGRPCETPYDEFRPFGPGGVPAYFATGVAAEHLLDLRSHPEKRGDEVP